MLDPLYPEIEEEQAFDREQAEAEGAAARLDWEADPPAVRAYYIGHEAWYADHLREDAPEIMVGLYEPNGHGTDGEFAIRWIDLDGVKIARLEAFDDSWKVLGGMTDLIGELAAMNCPTQEEVIALLDKMGFKDFTQYTR